MSHSNSEITDPEHKVKSLLYVTSGSFGLYATISIYKENEKFYDTILVPVMHKLNPETAHNVAVLASKYGLVPKSRYKDPDLLKTEVWKLKFSNPVGMAAGFDKQGEIIKPLHDIGFGFVEVGSVTPLPQEGNKKPRLFRLKEDKAIINRYGFNSNGHSVVYERIRKLKNGNSSVGIIGVSLGKNKDSSSPVNDYVDGIKKFGDVADYLVINISSPNTPGLRTWQKKHHLEELLETVVKTRDELPTSHKPPLLLKLAPDLTTEEKQEIADVICKHKCRVDGLIISNSTVERMHDLKSAEASEEGGLSGKPLRDMSTAFIAEMYKLTGGRIPIIGVGGIFTGRDAYDKISAGASLVQLYTSFIYHGPPRVNRVKAELEEILRENGLTVSEAVGKSINKVSYK